MIPKFSNGDEYIIWLLEQILAQLQIQNGKTKLKFGEKFDWKDSVTVLHK